MKVLSPEARKRYHQAGAAVDEASQVVRLDRALVAAALATAPPISPCMPWIRNATCRCRTAGWASRRRPAAQHHGHGTRPARRHPGGLLQPDQTVPKLRGHPHPRRRNRAAGCRGQRAASARDPCAVDALRQDSLHLFARPRPGRRQFRTDPPRTWHHRRGIPHAAIHLHHHQHQFATAARHTHGRWHHRFCGGRTSAGHHAVYAGGRHGAGDDCRRIDAGPRRGARGPHPGANRAARSTGGLRQFHLECRHEIRVAGLRHAGIRQSGVRRRPAGALPRPALALLERHRVQRSAMPSRPTSRR